MLNLIMLVLLVAVIGTSFGVFFWFSRKLNKIEVELWGDKKKEAAKTAQDASIKSSDSESDDNKPEE